MLKNLSRILLVIALVAVLGISSHPLPVLAAYSCGNPSTNHCYGVNQWQGAVSGTHTYMGVVLLQCACTGNNFILNDQWLVQEDSNGNALYWIEGGYITIGYNTGVQYEYFWADKRPIDNTLWFHDSILIPSGDVGLTTQFNIHNSNASTGEWQVLIGSPNANTLSYTSISNFMTPNRIDIGMELSGTSGASAPTAHFTNNYYFPAGGPYTLQTSNGYQPTPISPVQAGWSTPPSQLAGGDWYTYCPC